MTASTETSTLNNALIIPPPLQRVYRAVAAEDRNSVPKGAMRLDAPCHARFTHWEPEDARVAGCWAGLHLAGTATVARQHAPGPPAGARRQKTRSPRLEGARP
jgi:hypothetical protein